MPEVTKCSVITDLVAICIMTALSQDALQDSILELTNASLVMMMVCLCTDM